MRGIKYILTFLLFGILIFSCNQRNKKEIKILNENEEIQKNNNITETTSEDLIELAKVLDFSIYKPKRVKFKYTLIDNSRQNERLSVPGSSDYYLEALMEFDSETFEKMKDFERNLEWVEQNHKKEEFDFDWLSENIRTELYNSPTNYKGHPDFFFKSGVNGKLWYLKNKVLLKSNSN